MRNAVVESFFFNSFLSLSSSTFRIVAADKIPIEVQFELTWRCNQRCIHCYQFSPEGEVLSTRQIKDIILQLKGMLTGHIMRVTAVFKAILYSTLFIMAIVWGIYGSFTDFWDAALTTSF